MPCRLVVLASGVGTLLQHLIDACADGSLPAQIVAVGADRDRAGALARARSAGIPIFVHKVGDYPDRASWDRALTQSCASYEPDLLISAEFLKPLCAAFICQLSG